MKSAKNEYNTAGRDAVKEFFKEKKYFRKEMAKVARFSKSNLSYMKSGDIGMATQMLMDIKFYVDNVLEEIADEFDMPELVDESIKEATYKLRRGSTASDLDELDAMLSRMKILQIEYDIGALNMSKISIDYSF